jgi:hypothetical protein
MDTTDTAASLLAETSSASSRRGVHTFVSRPAFPVLLAALALGGASCGRSELDDVLKVSAAHVDAAAPEAPRDLPPDRPPVKEAGPPCKPAPETCNGIDDDCNGQIDDNLPPIPCPNGGDRYCVAGRYSDCPRRCDACVPGSQRTCITSFCTFWGTQSCAADGRSFGTCKETLAPLPCRDIANKMQRSPELEQCCIMNGFCCVDEFDLDHDGDHTNMLGRCEAVVCDP